MHVVHVRDNVPDDLAERLPRLVSPCSPVFDVCSGRNAHRAYACSRAETAELHTSHRQLQVLDLTGFSTLTTAVLIA